MSDFVDEKALEIATQLSAEYEIVDPRIIATIQLGAAEGIKSVFHPYKPFEYITNTKLNVQNLIGMILNSDLSMLRWSVGNDESGIKITLARQRKHISDLVKEAIESGELKTEMDDTLTTKVGTALKSARGWLLTCISSAKAGQDLKLVDDALDDIDKKIPCTCLTELEDSAYGSGGPMSGMTPPVCQAKIHKSLRRQ